MGENEVTIQGKTTIDFDMTSDQAARLLAELKDPEKLKRLLGPKLDGLGEYGITITDEKLVFAGTDEPPHDPAYEAPSEELVEEVRKAIQAVIRKTSRNPPMFAICSRIAAVAYSSAATPSS
jgi:hypothetical protein